MPKRTTKPGRVDGVMQNFILHRSTTVVEEIKVCAMDEAEAREMAALFTGPPVGEPRRTYTKIANWPINDPQEVEYELPDGYRVRRGWFWRVRTFGAPHPLGYHGDRTLSFTAAEIDPEGKGVTDASFAPYLHEKERPVVYSRCYGWAASHGDLVSWSDIFDTPQRATKSCRKFIEEQRQFHRDRQRAEHVRSEEMRMERLMNKVLLRMLREGGKLTRLKGGKWITDDPGYYPDGEPRVFDEKWMVEMLIDGGHVDVTDRMNQSGDPRIVELTEQGRARALLLEKVPEEVQ